MKIYKTDGTFIMEVEDLSTDLRWANLISADLTGANLEGANLTNADLYKADFTGAFYNKETDFGIPEGMIFRD